MSVLVQHKYICDASQSAQTTKTDHYHKRTRFVENADENKAANQAACDVFYESAQMSGYILSVGSLGIQPPSKPF